MELFPDVLTLRDGQVDAPGQLFAKVRPSGSVNHLWPRGGAVVGGSDGHLSLDRWGRWTRAEPGLMRA